MFYTIYTRSLWNSAVQLDFDVSLFNGYFVIFFVCPKFKYTVVPGFISVHKVLIYNALCDLEG